MAWQPSQHHRHGRESRNRELLETIAMNQEMTMGILDDLLAADAAEAQQLTGLLADEAKFLTDLATLLASGGVASQAQVSQVVQNINNRAAQLSALDTSVQAADVSVTQPAPAPTPSAAPDAPVPVADQRAAGVAPEDTVTIADQNAGVPAPDMSAPASGGGSDAQPPVG